MPGHDNKSRWLPWLLVAVLLAVALPFYLVLNQEREASPRQAVAKDKLPETADSAGGGRQSSPGSASATGDPDTAPPENRPPPFRREWFAPWGNGPGQMGKRQPREGAPEGPMAFAVIDEHRSVVLDQVNQRLVFFSDGRAARTVALDGDTYQDLQVDGQGRVWLVDRLAGRKLVLLDEDGKTLARIPLEGEGVGEGSAVTGLFVYRDGAWVEVEHSRQVHLTDAGGKALEERPSRPGRLTRDGRLLIAAALEGRQAAVITVRPAGQPAANPRVLARVPFSLRVLHLLLLDSDLAGNIYLGAHLAQMSPDPPYGVVAERLEVVVLGPDGGELDRIELAASAGALEQFRSLLVTADGAVYQLWFGAEGVELRRVR
ncbi:MAG: hypothetical protein DRI34_05835 [Deltaproteobacteria bacterium]|nr:MAG: hypothetical protein DRI34_05835 [Deltaproteobacteria bacterium]